MWFRSRRTFWIVKFHFNEDLRNLMRHTTVKKEILIFLVASYVDQKSSYIWQRGQYLKWASNNKCFSVTIRNLVTNTILNHGVVNHSRYSVRMYVCVNMRAWVCVCVCIENGKYRCEKFELSNFIIINILFSEIWRDIREEWELISYF